VVQGKDVLITILKDLFVHQKLSISKNSRMLLKQSRDPVHNNSLKLLLTQVEEVQVHLQVVVELFASQLLLLLLFQVVVVLEPQLKLPSQLQQKLH